MAPLWQRTRCSGSAEPLDGDGAAKGANHQAPGERRTVSSGQWAVGSGRKSTCVSVPVTDTHVSRPGGVRRGQLTPAAQMEVRRTGAVWADESGHVRGRQDTTSTSPGTQANSDRPRFLTVPTSSTCTR